MHKTVIVTNVIQAFIANATVNKQIINVITKNMDAKNIRITEQMKAVVKKIDKIQIDIQIKTKFKSKHIAKVTVQDITIQFIIAIIQINVKIAHNIVQAIITRTQTTIIALQYAIIQQHI